MKPALLTTTAAVPVVNSHDGRPSRRTLLGWTVGLAAALAAGPAGAARAGATAMASDEGHATGSLFDGATLGRWQPVNFGGEGEVRVEDGHIVLGRGNDLTGIVWTGDPLPPTYAIDLEARRMDGTDFFCALTFPVADSHCTFVVGGWGGSLIGFSSIDGYDASENETAQVRQLVDERWYRIRVEVSADRMRARLDEEWLAEVATANRQIDVRIEMLSCRPLGIASYRTIAEIRNIRVSPLPA